VDVVRLAWRPATSGAAGTADGRSPASIAFEPRLGVVLRGEHPERDLRPLRIAIAERLQHPLQPEPQRAPDDDGHVPEPRHRRDPAGDDGEGCRAVLVESDLVLQVACHASFSRRE
jgi:hypothetical protein